MRKLTDNQQAVLNYLQQYHQEWLTPTQIGIIIGNKRYNSASSWASPICKRLVTLGLAYRSGNGHYRAVKEVEDGKAHTEGA